MTLEIVTNRRKITINKTKSYLKLLKMISRDFLGYKKNVGFTMLLKNVRNVNSEQTALVF